MKPGFLFCWLYLFCVVANSATPLARLVVENGVIELEADQIPVADVIQAVGDKVGFSVVFEAPINRVITGAYTAKSVENLLTQLNLQHVVSWKDENGELSVQAVYILPEGQASEFLHSGATVESAVPREQATHQQRAQVASELPVPELDTATQAGDEVERRKTSFKFTLDPKAVR